MDASGCTTRRIEGFLMVCELGLWESMSAERDGVYEGIYRSRKYCGGPTSNGIGQRYPDCFFQLERSTASDPMHLVQGGVRKMGFSCRSVAQAIQNAILKRKARCECKTCLMLQQMVVPVHLENLSGWQMAKTSAVYRRGYYNRNKHQIEPWEGLNQHFTQFWCFYPSYVPSCHRQPAKAQQISKSRHWC